MKIKSMKNKNYSLIILFALFLIGCKSTSDLDAILKTYPVASKEKCQEKGGHWYKGKCWANFNDFDDNFTASEIDVAVDKELDAVKEFGIAVDTNMFGLDLFIPQPEENEITFISVFTNGKNKQTLVQVAPADAMDKKSFDVQTVLFNADAIALPDGKDIDTYRIAQGTAKAVRTGNDEDTMVLTFNGNLSFIKDDKIVPYTMKAGMALMGIGNTTIRVKEDTAYLNGILGTVSYKQFKDLIRNHPEVKTIVLENVPGSMNDAVNMHTARLIKNAGLTTKVLADSDIASGGVDLFCAGRKRIVTKGAKVGVHSWSGGDFTAAHLPKDHPAHQYQITYFNEVLGAPDGENFYFYTLQAAPFDGVHWMGIDEMKKWNVATQIITK